jgi:hypothetical protein
MSKWMVALAIGVSACGGAPARATEIRGAFDCASPPSWEDKLDSGLSRRLRNYLVFVGHSGCRDYPLTADEMEIDSLERGARGACVVMQVEPPVPEELLRRFEIRVDPNLETHAAVCLDFRDLDALGELASHPSIQRIEWGMEHDLH